MTPKSLKQSNPGITKSMQHQINKPKLKYFLKWILKSLKTLQTYWNSKSLYILADRK
jgi:hypothetical protein